MSKYEKALTARDALVLSIPEAGFGNERANVAIQNLAKVGWQIVPRHHSPGPSGYSPDEFIDEPIVIASTNNIMAAAIALFTKHHQRKPDQRDLSGLEFNSYRLLAQDVLEAVSGKESTRNSDNG